MTPLRVLVVGCGHMGKSHARAYHNLDGFELAGLVSRKPEGREGLAAELDYEGPLYASFEDAMEADRFDVVSINTYPDTHEAYALAAIESGAHVFLEKPVAPDSGRRAAGRGCGQGGESEDGSRVYSSRASILGEIY